MEAFELEQVPSVTLTEATLGGGKGGAAGGDSGGWGGGGGRAGGGRAGGGGGAREAERDTVLYSHHQRARETYCAQTH